MLIFLDRDVKVLEETLDLDACIISWVVLGCRSAVLEDLFEDLKIGFHPRVLDLKDD